MQAIRTKYIAPTNSRGARIKAECDRGAIFVPYPHELSGAAVHVFAAQTLIDGFVNNDKVLDGFIPETNPWSAPRVCGQLPDGSYAHVFVL